MADGVSPRSWSKLTVTQLKEELEQRSLETTGKKADLVARLEAYEQVNSNGDAEEVAEVEEDAEDDEEQPECPEDDDDEIAREEMLREEENDDTITSIQPLVEGGEGKKILIKLAL
jgi:hypothetical protein